MPRIDLAKNIPLPAPLAIYVEPTNVCNYKCGICPVSLPDYAGAAGYFQKMKLSTWMKIHYDILDWGIRPHIIRFFNTGEPLLNPELHLMIRTAQQLTDHTSLYTNGSLLYGAKADQLLDSGLEYLRVSVYGTSSVQYVDESGQSRFTLLDVISNVNQFRSFRDQSHTDVPTICAQLIATKQDKKIFKEQWHGIADEVGFEPLHNWGDTLVQLGEFAGEKLVCPSPFYEMIIKANGDVTVCCVDWSNKLVVGNVLQNTLKEIWEGEPLRQFQELHLSGNRKQNPICRDCNQIYTRPDNLDSLVSQRMSL